MKNRRGENGWGREDEMGFSWFVVQVGVSMCGTLQARARGPLLDFSSLGCRRVINVSYSENLEMRGLVSCALSVHLRALYRLGRHSGAD